MLKKLNPKNHIQFIKNISLRVNEKYEYLSPKLNFVLDTFESIYHLKKPILISYSMNTNEGVHVMPGSVGKLLP